MRWLALMVLFAPVIWSPMAAAAHSFGGLDLCTTYPEKMPPGIITASQLPPSPAVGVALMQRYCEQCHYLPGPGRHTAAEWPVLLRQMNMLMDVSNRFGNLMGKILTPTSSEREIIRDYLIANALLPLAPVPDVIKGSAYERHCDNCHALPDPQQHSAAEWLQVVQRMLKSMEVMKYSPPSAVELKEIAMTLGYSVVDGSLSNESASAADAKSAEGDDEMIGGSVLALGPFVLLMLIGLVRWLRNKNSTKNLSERGDS